MTVTWRSAEANLAVAEGRRLLGQPALWLSVLTLASWALFVGTATEEHFLLTGFGLVVPAFTAMVLVALATRRSRAQGADELFDVLPVSAWRRSVGHGVSGLAVGLFALAATVVVWAYRRPGAVLGVAEDTVPSGLEIPRPNVAQLLQGPMAAVALCALGVAVARWVVGWLLTIALFVPPVLQFVWFGLWMADGLHPNTWWWPFAGGWVHGGWVGPCSGTARCDLEVSGFDTVTPWWHLAYIAAITAALVAVAVLRHRRDRAAWLAFGTALAAVVASVIVQAVVAERFVPTGGV